MAVTSWESCCDFSCGNLVLSSYSILRELALILPPSTASARAALVNQDLELCHSSLASMERRTRDDEMALCDYWLHLGRDEQALACFADLLASAALRSVGEDAHLIERAAGVHLLRYFDCDAFAGFLQSALCVRPRGEQFQYLPALYAAGLVMAGQLHALQCDEELSIKISLHLLCNNMETVIVPRWMVLRATNRLRRAVGLQQVNILLDRTDAFIRDAINCNDKYASDCWAFSGAMTHSLLALGATHLAVRQFLHRPVIDSALVLPSFDEPAVQLLLNQSSNVRAINLLSSWWSTDGPAGLQIENEDIMGTFIALLLETMHPVVLDSSHNWAEEVLLLRAVGQRILADLVVLCRRSSCNLSSAHAAARGLFLQPYQGISLLRPFLPAVDTLYDMSAGQAVLEMMRFQAAEVHPARDASANTIGNSSRVVVAFVSLSLSRHSVGRLLANIICGLDINRFSIIVVTDHRKHGQGDDVTEMVKVCIPPSNWLYMSNDAESLRNQLLGVDIVIYSDVAMQSTLFANVHMTKLAPVQVMFWGHPFTTADEGMDYFISSDSFEPAVARESWSSGQFSEQLVVFDSLSFQLVAPEPVADALPHTAPLPDTGSFVSYQQQQRASLLQWLADQGYAANGDKMQISAFSAVVTNCSSSGVRVYGVLQSLMKLHPLFDLAILRILQHDPCAVVVLTRNSKQWDWQRRLSARLSRSLAALSNAVHRVILVDQMPHKYYSRLLCMLDVSLDPFPFGGGVTLCDAVAGGCSSFSSAGQQDEGCAGHRRCSVPFITVGDLQSVHRIGVGIARRINDTNVAVSVTCSDLVPQCTAGINCLLAMRSYHEQCVDRYALAAVALAKTSALHQEQRAAHVHRAMQAIYEDAEVVEEWNRFLSRIVAFI